MPSRWLPTSSSLRLSDLLHSSNYRVPVGHHPIAARVKRLNLARKTEPADILRVEVATSYASRGGPVVHRRGSRRVLVDGYGYPTHCNGVGIGIGAQRRGAGLRVRQRDFAARDELG